ncbi:MAG: O-antigen ligase family protein [Anaerolineae bacterium]
MLELRGRRLSFFDLPLAGLAAAILLGLAVVVLSPQNAVVLLLALAGGVVVLLRPGWALLALPLAVPFGELRTLSLGGLTVGGGEIILAAVVVSLVARGLARQRLVIPRAPLLVPLLIFLGALLVSVPGALSLPAAVKELAKWLEFALTYLAVLIVADEATPRGRMAFVAAMSASLLLAGTLEAAAGIVQSVQRLGPPSYAILGGALWRAFGEFGQPNPFGGFMNMALLPALSGLVGIALGAGLTRRGWWPSAENGYRPSAVVAILLLLVAGVVGLGLILSWSRGAWLGAVAGVAAIVVAWIVLILARPPAERASEARRRAVAALWVLVALGLLLVFAGAANVIPSSVTDRLATVADYSGGLDVLNVEVNDDNFAVVERAAHWYAAANMWADHFWTGVGIGNYAVAYPQYNVPRWTDPLGHAHNYYLNIGAEAGFIGLLAYLVLIFAVLWRGIRVAADYPDWLTRTLAVGIIGVLVAVGVHNIFDNLYVHAMGVYIAILVSLVDTAGTRAR